MKMPNWVSNWVGASGTEADIRAFVEKAGKPYDTINTSWDATTKAMKSVEATHTEPFSFWNFIEPEDKVAYHADAHGEKPEGYADWTHEQKMAHDLQFSGNGWYDWNVREWGTKWDACDPCVNEIVADGKGNASVSITFETAWSIPEPVFRAMVAQHPTIDFDFESEEEQGWGAKYTSSDGDEGERSLILTEEWDIPDSHSDYVARDREDSCVCSWSDDKEDWYSDCPNNTQQFAVVVSRTYLVEARNAEEAWGKIDGEIVNAEVKLSDGIELADEDTAFVKDTDTGERLFPMSVAEPLDTASV